MNMIINNQITCDRCGSFEFYPSVRSEKTILRIAKNDSGWIVKGNKHYCCKQCEETKNES